MSTLASIARNASADAVAALAAGGSLRLYTAGFATLLAAAPCDDPAFSPAASGVASLASPITGVAVIASGTAAAFRLLTSAGATILEGTVGLTSSGSDIEFDQVLWSSGDLVDIPTFTITTPAG